MAKIRELCGLIHEQYDTETALARAIGWPRQRLNKITTGTKEPSLEEVAVLASALNAPFDRVANIFLRQKSPNGQQTESA